jgi:4-amino-4-deoxy-L-arabinose transferase-like glycosyltransferase
VNHENLSPMKWRSYFPQLQWHHYWWLAAIAIVFLAAWVRLVNLDSTPAGMSWDEAALGYVGRMVVTTGRDEHGALLPRVFQSFGDYKAPLAFYITGISTALWGLHPWAVRLPFALAGIGTVILVIAIIRQLRPEQPWLALGGGFILATLPWQWLFSRVAFESGLALCFYAGLVWAWLKIRQSTHHQLVWWTVLILSGVAGLYVYHAARIVLPLSVLLILIHEWFTNRSWLQKQLGLILKMSALALLLLLPLIVAIVWQKGGERAAQTTIFSQSPNPWNWAAQFMNNLVVHLDWQFLVQGETTTLRHGTGSRGVLLYSQFGLFLAGITVSLGLLIERLGRPHQTKKWWAAIYPAFKHPANYQSASVANWLWLGLFGIGLLPALIGWEVPHANRALLAVLPMIILMVEAINFLQHEWSETVFSLVMGSLLLAMFLEAASFWRFYQTTYRLRSATDWLDGYESLVTMTLPWQRAGKKIKVDSSYGQPAIFFGFWEHTPATDYRAGQIRNVTFGTFDPQRDSTQYDIIAVSSDISWPGHLPHYQILRIDGSVAFHIYEISH